MKIKKYFSDMSLLLKILFGWDRQPKLAQLAEQIGVANSESIDNLKKYLKSKSSKQLRFIFFPHTVVIKHLSLLI